MDDLPRPAGAVLVSEAEIRPMLQRIRTVAVLGIKPESQAFQPAFYVPEYLAKAGFEVIPVPVYFPNVTHILGRPVYRSLRDIPGPVDLVNVFRRSEQVAAHVDDILAKRPRTVWLQLGIRHDAMAAQLTRAGIDVVQDRCLMVDHSRWQAGPAR
jgi:uncharacterized protein